MADLRRTPSVQHAIALIKNTVADTVLEMEKLDAADIRITLNPGRRMFKPMMEGQSLAWAISQLKLDSRKKSISANVGLVSAFKDYAQSKSVRWFRECESYGYPIGDSIIIPVRPAGFWVENGKFHVLWPQCWKGRTLDTTQRSLLNTILRATFFVGDFSEAELEWVDMCERAGKKGRGLEVLSSEELGSVSQVDLADHLNILSSAFKIFSANKAERKRSEKARLLTELKELPLFSASEKLAF